ncbi:hypothetical protein D3C84_955770 [compost metagenome]
MRSTRAATEAMPRLVSSANSPETAMPWPAWPSLMCRSAAIGVSRLTGMNSEATSANAASDMASTAPHDCRVLCGAWRDVAVIEKNTWPTGAATEGCKGD